MRCFFLFAPVFIEWPFAIAQEIRKTNPDAAFAGLHRGGKDVIRQISLHKENCFDPLYAMAELEQQWIDAEVDQEALAEFEVRFEPGFMKRIIVADRKMGYGYVTGGVVPPCALSRMSNDHDMVIRYFYGMASFIDRMLVEQKITHVFCYAVAGGFALALRELCRHHKIIFRQLEHTRIETLNILDDETPTLLAPIARLYQEALKNPDLVSSTIPQAELYIKKFREHPVPPGYMEHNKNELKRQSSWGGIVKQLYRDLYGLASDIVKRPERELEKTSEWDLLVHNLQRAFRMKKLAKQNPFRTVEQVPKRPYAYFPLHVDPEASTMILSPMHVNQIHIIESISKSLPLSWNLLVKEHFPMIGLRPNGFYEQIRRMPGVYLIHPFENNFNLIKNAHVTCTITGTAGWESLLLKRPAIVFGNTPYLALEQGMIHTPDLSNLPEKIQEALSIPPIDDRRLILYLAAVYKLSFEFPSHLLWGSASREAVEANWSIVEHISRQITEENPEFLTTAQA